MTDENSPRSRSEQSTTEIVSQILGEINLPKLIAGQAGESIARLIAGGTDIPAAWLQRISQSIRDGTAARSAVSQALAEAASEHVKADVELVKRAVATFIGKEIKYQANREAIAAKAIKNLNEAPDVETTSLDDDWLNMFARYAEQASSERMQEIWGRVLSGQLRSPKSFSLQTLRFVSELDKETADLFEKWSASVASGQMIPFPPQEGQGFAAMLALEDCNLISGATGTLGNTLKSPSEVQKGAAHRVSYHFRGYDVYLLLEAPWDFNFPIVALTRTGREIYSVTKNQTTEDVVKAFCSKLPKAAGVTEISYIRRGGQKDEQPTIFWAKSSNETNQTP